LLSILPEDLKVGFLEAMDDDAIYGSTIAELMTEEGYPIQPDAIRRHRNNRCKCKMRNEQKKKLDGG
jgi:hypothetical protein